MTLVSSISTKDETFTPVPNQLFSFIPNENKPPSVPTPAPAEISPVGCSSTIISIIFRSFSDPVLTFCLTEENICLAFNLDIDLSNLS